jgi:hypothetical protein
MQLVGQSVFFGQPPAAKQQLLATVKQATFQTYRDIFTKRSNCFLLAGECPGQRDTRQHQQRETDNLGVHPAALSLNDAYMKDTTE